MTQPARKRNSLPFKLRRGDKIEIVSTSRANLRILLPKNVKVRLIKRD